MNTACMRHNKEMDVSDEKIEKNEKRHVAPTPNKLGQV
jgi:hypothetical protein